MPICLCLIGATSISGMSAVHESRDAGLRTTEDIYMRLFLDEEQMQDESECTREIIVLYSFQISSVMAAWILALRSIEWPDGCD